MLYYAWIEPKRNEFHRVEAGSIEEVNEKIIKAMINARNNILYYLVCIGMYLAITIPTDFYSSPGPIPWITTGVVSAGLSTFFRPYTQARAFRLWNSAIIQNEPASHY